MLVWIVLKLNLHRRRHSCAGGAVCLAAALFSVCAARAARAQEAASPTAAEPQSVPEWQIAAGGKMRFEVASIRLENAGTFTPPNLDLSKNDTSIPPGGRLVADFPLVKYIEFAYKIADEGEAMIAHLPKWVATDHFVIQAKAEGNPTKDQIRLMMQSLLADRFKLAVHFETNDAPVLALSLKRPGEIGRRLRPHSEGPSCDNTLTVPSDPSSPSVIPGGFVPVCNLFQAVSAQDHTTIVLGARDVTLEQIAENLGGLGILGLPVVDQTRLSGKFDFSLSWMHERHDPQSPTAGEQVDIDGPPSFLEAVNEQFGLKLRRVKAPLQVLVIDHVEQPSPN